MNQMIEKQPPNFGEADNCENCNHSRYLKYNYFTCSRYPKEQDINAFHKCDDFTREAVHESDGNKTEVTCVGVVG